MNINKIIQSKIRSLRENEEVKTVLKRHWIVYVMLFLFFCLWVLIVISIYMILWFNILSNLLNIVFSMFFMLFMYMRWLDHELDMYVVTTNRIMWIEQKSFLDRNISECNLSQVQEVNSETKGLFANILNYGTLSIQTASTRATMRMKFCPDAPLEARKILNIVDEFWENTADLKS
jgi:membrane protein YdbS with pleckstrin-like domain